MTNALVEGVRKVVALKCLHASPAGGVLSGALVSYPFAALTRVG